MKKAFGKLRDMMGFENLDKFQYTRQIDLQPWNGSPFYRLHELTPEKLIQVLKHCPRNLQFLSLRSRNLDHRCVRPITQNAFENLRILSFDLNNIGAQGCRALSLGEWKSLQSLQLQGNKIEDKGVKYLMKMQSPRLQLLSLKDNRIGSQGVKVIVKNSFKNLRVLYLQENLANWEDLKSLARAETPSARIYLNLKQGSKWAAKQLQLLLKQSKKDYFYVEVDYKIE